MTGYFGGIHSAKHGSRAKVVGILLAVLLVSLFALIGFAVVNGSNTSEASNTAKVVETPTVPMVEVLVPVRNIEVGTKLVPSLFRKEARPRQGLPRRVIRDFEEIQGTYAKSLIVADVPLLADYITTVRPTNAISPEIPEGYRAVTIRVDATSAVEGWAKPGARVDVIWTTKYKNQQAVVTIVSNAKVLSAEQMTESEVIDSSTKALTVPSTVTLLVTAADAKKIQLARASGILSLTLRGDSDLGKADTSGAITLESLLGKPDKQEEPSERVEGIIKIGGVEYKLVGGKMVPAEQLSEENKR